MKALMDFVTTDYGLLSAAVIVGVVGMGVFYIRFFLRNMRADEARARQLGTR